jgi:hypothetical protein
MHIRMDRRRHRTDDIAPSFGIASSQRARRASSHPIGGLAKTRAARRTSAGTAHAPANRNALSARAVRRHVRATSWSTRAQFLLPLNQGFLRRRPKADQARKPALSFASSRARVETNGIRTRGKTMMQNFKYIIQDLSLGFERIVMAWI